MSAQYDEAFFKEYADSIITNNGTVDELRGQVSALYERLVSDAYRA